jgi:SAM-dependent methyltransferase
MADQALAAMREHYEIRYDEDRRLRSGIGLLEFVRVQEIVRGHLPGDALRILDVGGATGVHAEWLLEDGHEVHLVDPVESHVDRASQRLGELDRFRADVGDARRLPVPDASFDVVLLFGPLYHLVERADRLRAWTEARRAVRPGGLILAMGISRFASLFDGLANGYLFNADFRAAVAHDLATGRHENPTGDPRWFTTAYFHRPHELAAEAVAAGLEDRGTVGVEGMAHWMKHLAERWADVEERQIIVQSARATAQEPTLAGLSSHLIAVAARRKEGEAEVRSRERT